MTRIRLIVVICFVINIYSITCDNVSLETSTLRGIIANSTNSSRDEGLTMIRNEFKFMECMKKMCPLENFTSMKNTRVSDTTQGQKIHIALLLPSQQPKDQVNTQTLSAILPVIELAIENVARQKLLNGFEMEIHPRDTKCSSSIGPIEAFELHNRGEADVFLGPICDYVLAPVARYAAVWETSVISTSGLAAAFNYKVSQCRV
jgi:Receptor family ligand binding region